MSRQALNEFRQKISQDAVLQDEVAKLAKEKISAEGWVKLGAQYGFEFSAEDVTQLSNEAKDDSFELTDFEMEFVAGGEGK